MIHFPFPHKIWLKLLHITLLSKVLQIHMAQMHLRANLQYNSKPLPQQDNRFYKRLTINTIH